MLPAVVVKQEATVLDLKHGIKRFMTLRLSRNSQRRVGISWWVFARRLLAFGGMDV